MRRAWSAIVVLTLLPHVAWAVDYTANPATYREALHRLQAGDRLLLVPGDYRQGLPLHGLSGDAERPITIEAATLRTPPRFIARPGHNTVSLLDVRHIVLRNLELDGNNMAVDAIKAERPSRYADFVTLERLYIHNHAASQQNVGISTKCPAVGWVIRDNDIERVGTGLYLGNSDGSAPFVGGLIEGNRISRTLGYNLQIKHQLSQAGADSVRHDTIIRHNVFSKQDSQPRPLGRPNLLLGHFPSSGAGSEDRYLVYGNLFLHNPSEALAQAEGRVALYDNVFVNADGDALHIQPHNDVPRDIDIFSNTVLAVGNGIRIRTGKAGGYRQRVVGNVIAAGVPLSGGEAGANLISHYRPELIDVPPAGLTARLLTDNRPVRRRIHDIAPGFARYPGWLPSPLPGARVTPALLSVIERPRP